MEQASVSEVRSKAVVLVVDDDSRNRELIRSILLVRGHGVEEAVDGQDALEKVRAVRPDVVLLDVMMPGMDGFEVCRRLKGDNDTAAIPVMMVTSLSERNYRIRGIEAGANDFIVKPIDRQEVALRVQNAVQMKRLYDQVQAELARVRELEVLRENLIHFIVHDMRSPLMGIISGLEIVASKVNLDASARRYFDAAIGSAGQLNEMAGSMLDVHRMESDRMPLRREDCDIGDLAVRAADRISPLAALHGVRIDVKRDSMEAKVDGVVIERIFSNLLHNAVKFSQIGGVIEMAFSRRGDALRCEVRDAGPGIPPEYRDRIFDKFGGVDSSGDHRRYSTGLGLTFCRLAVEAHGGRIGVESEVGKGSTFWFELPVSPAGGIPDRGVDGGAAAPLARAQGVAG